MPPRGTFRYSTVGVVVGQMMMTTKYSTLCAVTGQIKARLQTTVAY